MNHGFPAELCRRSVTSLPIPNLVLSINYELPLRVKLKNGSCPDAVAAAIDVMDNVTHVKSHNTTLMTTIMSTTTSSISTKQMNNASCAAIYEKYTVPKIGLYCNWTFDSILCWSPTPAGDVVYQRCPPVNGVDTTKFAERRCGLDGRWEGKPNNISTENSNGWTNYTPCFPPEVQDLLNRLYAGGSEDIAAIKLNIAERTRTLEIVGLTLSLLALLLSLVIFCNFRSLRNNRTRIHKNLFVAMVIQVIVRLTLYLDQAIIRNGRESIGSDDRNGIENTRYICEASYVFLEYARTAMFLWMFIEGLYLHNVVTGNVFHGRFPHRTYAILGWGSPILLTMIWAIVTALKRGHQKCWWGYNLTAYYWILEGPRVAVISLNFFFLLNIIRVLVVKLRQSQTSDVEQVRKAVRAAVVLLPLLGITNILNMTEAPLDRTPWEFALWSYITYFLTSFQGFFIAVIYCFMNGEVRAALIKSLNVYLSLRGHSNWTPRRASMYSAAYNTAPDTDPHCHNDSIKRQDSSPEKPPTTTKTTTTPNTNNLYNPRNRPWMMLICFRGQKVLREPPATTAPPESVVFEL